MMHSPFFHLVQNSLKAPLWQNYNNKKWQKSGKKKSYQKIA